MIFSIVLALDCCCKVIRENICKVRNKDLIHVFSIQSILSCRGFTRARETRGAGREGIFVYVVGN